MAIPAGTAIRWKLTWPNSVPVPFDTTQIEHPVEDVVLLGDTALVFGQMNADLTVNGTDKTLNNNALAVWTKEHGIWKFVAYQPTPRAHS